MRPLLLLLGLVTTSSLAAWPLPPPLETAHLLGKGVPGSPPVALTDELYALGWSRNNALAVLERRDQGDGSRLVRFRIYDLVEDRVLRQTEWPDWGEDGLQAAWWEARLAEVEPLFAQFGLVPTTWQLGVFPLILDNEYYTVALRSSFNLREPTWIDGLEILVHSTGRGLKSVTTLRGYWRWAQLVGFLASPYENRVALVALVQPSGWRGEEQPLRFVVTGLSLKAGFPAP